MSMQKPSSLQWGNGKGKFIDVLEVMENLTKSSVYALKILTANREHDENFVASPIIHFVASKNLDKGDAKRYGVGLTGLIKRDLVRSYGRGKVMINPYLIVPPNFSEHILMWNSLEKEKKD